MSDVAARDIVGTTDDGRRLDAPGLAGRESGQAPGSDDAGSVAGGVVVPCRGRKMRSKAFRNTDTKRILKYCGFPPQQLIKEIFSDDVVTRSMFVDWLAKRMVLQREWCRKGDWRGCPATYTSLRGAYLQERWELEQLWSELDAKHN